MQNTGRGRRLRLPQRTVRRAQTAGPGALFPDLRKEGDAMLRQLQYDQKLLKERAEVQADRAAYPLPFPQVLEFNPPVHETWNIVHIGMNLPEAHQIYICGINCMRGVVLTAAEMNCLDRFHSVTIDEQDIISGRLEGATADGVADVLRKLPELPPAVIVFTVCTHHFVGCDLNYIYRKLEEEFPQVQFIRAYMDPLLQKEGATPDQKLRTAMCGVLSAEEATGAGDPAGTPAGVPYGNCETAVAGAGGAGVFAAAVLGSNVPLEEGNDIARMLAAAGAQGRAARLLQAPSCSTYEEYCRMGAADVFLSNVPNGREGAVQTAQRLGKKSLHMPMSFSYEEIRTGLEALREAAAECGCFLSPLDYEAEEQACEAAMARVLELVGDMEICIDYASHPTPVGMARYLLQRGFRVTKIYLNAFLPEDAENVEWMRVHAPQVRYAATVQPECRVLDRSAGGDFGTGAPDCGNSDPSGAEGAAGCRILAIGPHAAWFSGTAHFVNLVEGGGLWGYQGIRRLAELMEDAYLHPKDTEDLVPRKGLGCESCI